MTKDHIFLQANQVVDFPLQRGLGQHFRGFLERSGRDEAGTLHRSFGDSKQLSIVLRHLRLSAFGRSPAFGFNLQVRFFKQLFRNHLSLAEPTRARIGDSDALGNFVVDRLEIKTIQNHSRQHVSITRGFNFHFSKHASDDDLNMFIIDLNALASIDRLNLMLKILLNGLFT